MGRLSTSGLTISGSVLVLIGVIAFAIPVFTTRQTTEVARIGDLSVSTSETAAHTVPGYLASGALVLGALLIGAGLIRSR